MKKTRLWLAIFCLCAVAYFFREELLSATARYSADKFLQSKFHTSLNYEKLEADASSIVILHPVLTHQDGIHTASADKIAIAYQVDWLHRILTLNIHLEGVDTELLRQPFDWAQIIPSQDRGLYSVQGSIAFEDGRLRLFTSPDDATEDREFLMSGKLAWGEGMQGELSIAMEPAATASNDLYISCSQSPSGHVTMHWNADELDCRPLADLAQLLAPSLQGWEALRGVLNSSMTVTYSPETPLYAEGSFNLRDLVANNERLGVFAVLDQADLELQPAPAPNNITAPKSGQPLNLNGELSLAKGCAITFEQHGVPYCEIVLDNGSLHLKPDAKAQLNMHGNIKDGDAQALLFVKGAADYTDRSRADAQLTIELAHTKKASSIVNINVNHWGQPHYTTKFESKNLGPADFAYIQHFLEHYAPAWNLFNVQRGSVDAVIKADFNHRSGLTDLHLESLQAIGLQCDLPRMGLGIGAGSLTGSGSINLAFHTPYETLQGAFNLSNGEIKLEEFNHTFWHFTNIQSQLSIKQGIIQASDASVELAGMKGTAHFDWTQPQEIMKITLNGKSQDLIPFVPKPLQTAIKNQFQGNTLHVETTVHRQPHGARVAGQIAIQDPAASTETIRYGFDLDRKGRSGQDTREDDYLEKILPSFVKMAVPHIARPAGNVQAPWMRRGVGVGDLALRNGWFEAFDLPLSKYVQPFLFTNHPFTLAGRSDCKGTFNPREISVRYNGRNIYFELEAMTIEAERVPAKDPETSEEALPAFHYFDLETLTNFGFIPIQNATYFDKKTGLLFTDLEGDLILDGEKFHIPDIQGYCCGLSLGGQIDADFSSTLIGVGEVAVYAHRAEGKLSQVQQIFAHFNPDLFFLKIPLEGNVAASKKGGSLYFSISPERDEIEADIQGSFTDGEACCESGDIALKDLSFNFDIDSKAKSLQFTDFQGTLLLGSPSHYVEEYSLSGQGVRFKDYSQASGDFDFGISDKAQDIIHLSGKTQAIIDEAGASEIVFDIDREGTHFGDIHPTVTELVLADWTKIDAMHIGLNFRLSTFLHELQRFNRTGLFLLSRSMLERLGNMKTVSGDIDLALDYDCNSSSFLFDIRGADLDLDAYHYKDFLINGHKRGKTWVIEQLKLDDLSIGAEVEVDGPAWQANFLGIQAGDSLLAGLDGTFNEQTHLFEGKVNLLEVDLARLDEWKSIHPFVAEYSPCGKLKGTGKISVANNDDKGQWTVDTLLDLSTSGVSLKGLELADSEHIACHAVTDQSLTFSQLKTAIVNPAAPGQSLPLNIEKTSYDFSAHELELEGARFGIDAQNLPWAAELLNTHFPDAVDLKAKELLSSLKSNGTLNGSFHLVAAPGEHNFRLGLEDGAYNFFGKEYELKKFILEKDEDELKVATQVMVNRHLLWLAGHARGPEFRKGEIILADGYLTSDLDKRKPPLTIDWEKTPDNLWQISKAEGSIAGLDFHLVRDAAHSLSDSHAYLEGEIHIDGRHAEALFSDSVSETMRNWKVGSGYTLKGFLGIALDGKPAEDLDVHFQGQIEGFGWQLKGYQLQNLLGNVYYTPNHLQITNLTASDPAGAMHIETIDTRKTPEGEWIVQIPRISITDFTPSLLTNQEHSPAPSKSRTLTVRQMSVEDILGIAGEPATFTGRGSLSFVNPPRGSLQNTIFAIPAEILSRIGLNTGIMTPVRGTIQFDIKDAQVQLTKFKDIYSERDLSKFYLSKSSEPSFVDFDGNVFVQVRMKQYNLLFKFAELFTVTVQGTLQKPTYTLRKQPRFGKDKNVEQYEVSENGNS